MQQLTETDFCEFCRFYGEPNGCNRKGGECEEHAQFCEMLEDYSALKERRQWIPVSERLPESDGHYLVLSEMNWAHGGTWESNDGDAHRNMAVGYFSVTGFNIPHVTHWQPLPEPPEEAQDET